MLLLQAHLHDWQCHYLPSQSDRVKSLLQGINKKSHCLLDTKQGLERMQMIKIAVQFTDGLHLSCCIHTTQQWMQVMQGISELSCVLAADNLLFHIAYCLLAIFLLCD